MHQPVDYEVFVKLVIEFETEEYPGITQSAAFTFTDTGPDFPQTNYTIEYYQNFNEVEIDMWQMEMPKPIQASATHVSGNQGWLH